VEIWQPGETEVQKYLTSMSLLVMIALEEASGVSRGSTANIAVKTEKIISICCISFGVLMPWLCTGDFNEVLSQDEHFGRHEREDWQMAWFREAVEYRDFTDLGYSGLPYTWENKQVGGDNVKARLDRVFGDDRFLQSFGATNVSTYKLLNLITVPCWSRLLADPDNVQTKF
jgi:hypothetical protein